MDKEIKQRAQRQLRHWAQQLVGLYTEQGVRLAKEQTKPGDYRHIAGQVYVEPESNWVGEERQLLKRRCDSFLTHDRQRVMILLGDPGAGKTTFAKRYLMAVWQHYLAHTSGRVTVIPEMLNEPIKPVALPLFIRLNQTLQDKRIRLDRLLEDVLAEKVGLSAEQIKAIKVEEKLIVFLDGYDEIGYKGNLYQTNGWQAWKELKCIISTRPEKFGALSGRDFQDALLHAFSPVPCKGSIPESMVLSQLQLFVESQINKFIQQWNKYMPLADWITERYQTSIQEIAGLSELTSNPVILSLLLYALPSIVEKQAANNAELERLERIDVYDEFVGVWFRQQAVIIQEKLTESWPGLVEKLQYTAKDWQRSLAVYTTQLAYWSVEHNQEGKLNVDIPQEETLAERLLIDLTNENQPQALANRADISVAEKRAILRALRSGCLLNCQDGYFHFFHKSILEYFAQRYMVAGVKGNINQITFIEEAEQQKILSHYQTFNHRLAEPNLLRLLAEQAKRDEAFKKQLPKIIQLSRECPEVAYAAANALTIWHYAGEVIGTLSLQGVRVPEADLSGAILHLADARGADFSGVNFRGAYLAGANFEGAVLADCQWNNLPKIQFQYPVTALVYSTDGNWLIVGDGGGNIHFTQTDTYQVEKTCQLDSSQPERIDAVTCLAIDGRIAQPNQTRQPSRYLAVGSREDKIYWWEPASYRCIGGFQYKEEKSAITALACHPDGEQLASARRGDNTICVWDVKTKQALRYLTGHTSFVTCLAYSPQGSEFASGSYDNTVRLWELATGKERRVLTGHTESVTCLAYSPQGTELASGSDDKTVRLWELATGKERRVLTGHTDYVSCLAN
ncbi:MAG: pentapeptide repeat-containing protein, partial [Gammaproteobacteria bacterium]